MGTAKNEFFRLPRKPANAHFIRVFGDAEKFFCTYLTQSDDLGRVVIPKEIRRTLRIREGDPLEIFTEREGSVILRKYSPIGEIGAVAGLYAESLAHTMNCIVCLTDMDQIVAASGSGSKELLNRYISKELEYAIQARKQIRTEKRKADYIPIFAGGEEYSQEIICPIISGGDVMGTVVFLHKEEHKKFSEVEEKMAAVAAEFLGRQMEQ